MKSQKNKAFTLVELIIVITILAILRTIGFMSFQTYTTDARDGKRKTDLGEIRNGLEIYQLKNQILPTPDAQLLTVKTGSLVISYQGYLGTTIQKTIRLTSETKDPKDNNYYTYSTNGTRTKYQLLAMLENNPALAYNQNTKIINQANARIDYTTRYTYSVGNKIGIFLTGTTNAPLQETLTGVDLSSNNSTYKLVFSNSTNSGTISSSGTRLYTEIVNNQGTGGTAIQSNSCTTQPAYTNATFTIGNPTSVGQARQNTNVGNPCYYVCTGGYSGNDCSSKINIVDFFGDSSGIALYSFENNVLDTSGNYNGTDTNLTYTSGKFGTGGSFNGTNSKVDTNTNLLIPAGNKTITAWIKTTSSGIVNIMGRISGSSGDVGTFRFSVDNGKLKVVYSVGGNWNLISQGTTPVNDGNWHLATFVMDYSNLQSWLQVDSNAREGFDIYSGADGQISNITIGVAMNEYYFNGSMDQVRIFNKALSQAEVTRLFNEN